MKELAEHLRMHAEDYREAVHRHFFSTVPQSRQIFALSMSSTHLELAPAVAWLFDRAHRDGSFPEDIAKHLAQMGRDHRRHGFPAEVYPQFAASLVVGFEVLGLTPHQREVAARAVQGMCALMGEAAREADLAGEAPAYSAQVVDVYRPNRDTSIIRLESGTPFDYAPGQSVAATSQLLPGTWRQLTPAHPADPSGQLEFHLTAAGDASSMLAKAQPGDWWTLGTPTGEVPVLADAPFIILAFGTGWATVRALLLDALQRGEPLHRHTVYTIATSPGRHYDTFTQAHIRRLAPSLDFVSLVREERDPWLLGARPAHLHFQPVVAEDPAAAIVEREGAGRHKRYFLVGPADHVEVSRNTLLNCGVAEECISDISWQRGHEWAASTAQLDGWGDWEAWARAKMAEWASAT